MNENLNEDISTGGSAQTQIAGGETGGEQTNVQQSAAVDEWMSAPESYKQEYKDSFKSLSPEWRKYLIEREKQVEKGFSEQGTRLDGYKWVDEAYNSRRDRLGGMSSREYFEQLAAIDDAFETDPAATLKALAEYYNVNQNSSAQREPWQNEINQLKREYSSLRQSLQNQENNRIKAEFDALVAAKDEAGNLKFPYINEVKNEMGAAFAAGKAKNFAEAYDLAVWLNPDVREKMIAAKAEADLKAKAEAAAKAKNAAFAPKGKEEGINDGEMSTRDVLLREFRKQGYDV